MNTILYYIHDPMCSWCWGYQPTWHELQQYLPKNIRVEYVVGGLAPDSNSPMPMAQQEMIKSHWRTIEQKLGTRFNYEFWTKNTPRRSTYNACRAVIAAEKQGFQKPMIAAIQQGYYLQALNPSDLVVLINLAKELIQDKQNQRAELLFSSQQFSLDIVSVETEQELIRQIKLARVLSQQGFPALVLEHDGKHYQIAIDYSDYRGTLAGIVKRVAE